MKRDDFKPLSQRKGDPAKASKYIQAANSLVVEMNKLTSRGADKSVQAQFLRALALQVLHEALLQSPTNTTIYNSIADLLMKLEEFESAEAYYVRGLELAPWDRDARLYRGFALLKIRQKKPEEAEIIRREGVLKHPLDARQLWEDLAIGYHAKQSYSRSALCAFTALMQKNPLTRLPTCQAIYDQCKAKTTDPELQDQLIRQIGDRAGDTLRHALRRNAYLKEQRLAVSKPFADLMKAKGASLESGLVNVAKPIRLSWIDDSVQNLLELTDPAIASVGPAWKPSGPAWESPALAYAGVSLAGDVPEQFDLMIEVERLSGQGEFVVGYPYRGQMAMHIFDFGGNKSGAAGLREGLYSQPLLAANDPVTLVVKVRKDSLSITAHLFDEIYFRSGTDPLPAVPANWKVPATANLFLGSNNSKFQVHGCWLMKPIAAVKATQVPAASGTPAESNPP